MNGLFYFKVKKFSLERSLVTSKSDPNEAHIPLKNSPY